MSSNLDAKSGYELTGIVNKYVNTTVDRNGLFRRCLELVERRSDVQFKAVRARPLEVLKSANRPASSGRNDLVAAFQCAQAQLASEAGAVGAYTQVSTTTCLADGDVASTHEVPVMSHTSWGAIVGE